MSARNTTTATPARSVQESLQQWKMYAASKDASAGSYNAEHKHIKAAQETKSLPQGNKAAFEAWKAKVTVAAAALHVASAPAVTPRVAVTAAAPHVSVAPAAAKITPRGRPAASRPPRRAPAVAGSAWGNFAAAIQQDDAAGAAKKQAESAVCGDLRPELVETYKNR